MSKKEVLFKFRDGIKSVKIGDIVVAVNYNRKEPSEYVVTHIGKKYLGVGYCRNGVFSLKPVNQFDLKTGDEHSNRGTPDSLYSNMEELKRAKLEAQTIDEVYSRLGNRYLSNNRVTYNKAVRILAILNEEGENE